MYVRNVYSEPVAAIRPGEGAEVDPRHRVVAAGIEAGHLVPAEAPTPRHKLREEFDRARARVAALEAENAALRAERDQLLALATDPKPATKRAAREG
jgi:hypothetical protein